VTKAIGDPEFEAWWKRYWGALGEFHAGPRKELALAAWKEALTVMTARDRRIEDTLATLREALREIERWEMPKTGHFHPDGTEQSYSWCYGSNGERDHIRSIARTALSHGETNVLSPPKKSDR
jgi:hypothetical protein